jgi:hypothetical protein
VRRGGGETSSGSGDGADFRVVVDVLGLALPELALGACGVAVGWAGAVALLLLVVAHEENLEDGGEEEEEAGCVSEGLILGEWIDLRSDDGDGEAGGVEPTDRAQGCRVRVLLALVAEAVFGV